jgi:hypothetical protein
MEDSQECLFAVPLCGERGSEYGRGMEKATIGKFPTEGLEIPVDKLLGRRAFP